MIDPTKDKKLEDLGLPKPFEPFKGNIETSPSPEDLMKAMEPALEETIKQMGTSEIQKTPEIQAESPVSFEVQTKEEPTKIYEQQPVAVASTTPVQPVTQIDKDPLVKDIENILSKGLEEDYKTLKPALKLKFRTEGEIAANKIKKLLEKSKVNFRKIVDIITKWLQIIPGVNKFFLIQEAKNKADRIIEMKNQENK